MYFHFLLGASLSNPLALKLKPLPALRLLGVDWIFCLAHLVPGVFVAHMLTA